MTIPKITLLALLLATTVGICPMQLQMNLQMSETMDHDMSDMQDSMPCSACFAASDNYALNDAQVFRSQPNVLAVVAFPVQENTNTILQETTHSSSSKEGPNSQAPPLIGTVILRT